MIVIVDYGMGNLGSVQNMLKKIGYSSTISSSYKEILSATKVILPGVGAFDSAIKNLYKLDLINPLKEVIFEHKKPTLGICLGMQLLTNYSEEGSEQGLGVFNANVKKFQLNHLDNQLVVPHMGWNQVYIQKENVLFQDNDPFQRFYFVHSYYVECADTKDVLTNTHYGHDFVSSFQKENVLGAQFHPEKSHKFGMDFLKNFCEQF